MTLVATKRALQFELIEDCALEAVSMSDGSQGDAMVGAPAAIPTGVPLTPQNQVGIVLLVIGLALLAFGAGWTLGQRQTAGLPPLPDPGSRGA